MLKLFGKKLVKYKEIEMKKIRVEFFEHDDEKEQDTYKIIIPKRKLIDLINTLGNEVTISITIPKRRE